MECNTHFFMVAIHKTIIPQILRYFSYVRIRMACHETYFETFLTSFIEQIYTWCIMDSCNNIV